LIVLETQITNPVKSAVLAGVVTTSVGIYGVLLILRNSPYSRLLSYSTCSRWFFSGNGNAQSVKNIGVNKDFFPPHIFKAINSRKICFYCANNRRILELRSEPAEAKFRFNQSYQSKTAVFLLKIMNRAFVAANKLFQAGNNSGIMADVKIFMGTINHAAWFV